MKDQLARGSSVGSAGSGGLPNPSSLPSVGLSNSQGSKFFQKGPIKPSLGMPIQMLPTDQMVRQPQHHPQPQMMSQGRQPFGVSPKDFEEYYGEDYDPEGDEYDDEAPQRAGGRQLSPE